MTTASTPRYVVSGATGHLGHLVVEELLTRGVPADRVVATGRDLSRVADLADRGVTVARVDLDQPDTLADVLAEGDVFLLVSTNDLVNRAQHQADAVAVAGKAGVARIAYTSAPKADATTLAVAPDHAATEAVVRDSGLPFQIFRNNWYVENLAGDVAVAAETGVLASATGAGRTAYAARADYAAAIAGGLLLDEAGNTVYELGGPVAVTHADVAAAIAEALGREVVHVDQTPEERIATLTGAGLDAGTAGFVAALDRNIKDGELDVVTDDLVRLAGRPATPLVDAVRAVRAG